MTADPAALLRLATDIEALEEPDREMDARVAEAFGHKIEWRSARYTQEITPVIFWQTPHPYAGMREQCPLYTASVDAALSLMADVLPGYVCTCSTYGFASKMPIADVYREGHEGRAQGKAATLPLAIVAAVLRAVAAREGSDA